MDDRGEKPRDYLNSERTESLAKRWFKVKSKVWPPLYLVQKKDIKVQYQPTV